MSVLAIGWAVVVASVVAGFGTRLAMAVGRPIDADRRRERRSLPRVRAADFGLVGRVVADVAARRSRRHAEARIARDLPAAIDLLAVAVGAGWTPLLALGVVGRWAPPSVARSFAVAIDGFAMGMALPDAYALAARRSPAIAPLTHLLAASAVLGSPIAPALGRLAHEARLDQRRRAEARARTVPVRLLFPLVFLVLPAFALLTIVPAVVTGWRGA